MSEVSVLFPHQLFEKNPIVSSGRRVVMVEEYLFFRQYAFHRQKLAFHRASMQRYAHDLREAGIEVEVVESHQPESDVRVLVAWLKEAGVHHLHVIDPTDNWLEKRLRKAVEEHELTLTVYGSPLFINAREDLQPFFRPDKKKFFQTEFYIQQRKKNRWLIDGMDKPLGGKWSFDAENRKKYPKGQEPPPVFFPKSNGVDSEAREYVKRHFPDAPGALDERVLYPTSHAGAREWLQQFLEQRFAGFGTYEDAIVSEHSILNHSVLTPMLNVGLITPGEIVDTALRYGDEYQIPLNSVEGFLRQVTGWREFIRGVYEAVGTKERTCNYWGFERKIPPSFYTGTTGIGPIDTTIRKVLRTGYCHHIERLMVLGNFMLLCEFDPDEVYRWFMELFIDAYDWVMVPNIYGMSQFADGGLMSTKPYISGSNYLMKMSNYRKGEWQPIWDGLFWRFMHVHRDFFTQNPRLGMLVRTFDKMPAEKRNAHLQVAEKYLFQLGD